MKRVPHIRIPTNLWKDLCPLMHEMASLVPKLWSALIRGHWDDFDTHNTRMLYIIQRFMEVRTAEPVRAEDDDGPED